MQNNTCSKSSKRRAKKQSLYPLGIVSELSGLLSCDTGCGMRVGVILIYIFRYIVLYASQWSTTIINTKWLQMLSLTSMITCVVGKQNLTWYVGKHGGRLVGTIHDSFWNSGWFGCTLIISMMGVRAISIYIFSKNPSH